MPCKLFVYKFMKEIRDINKYMNFEKTLIVWVLIKFALLIKSRGTKKCTSVSLS